MSTEAKETPAQTRSLSSLWVGLFAGPVAFLLELQINYMVVPWACRTGHRFVLYLVVLLALLITAVGLFSAWRGWNQMGREWPDESGGAVPRNRFMAAMGIVLSLFFFIVVLALGIPNFVLHPCQP